MWERWRATCSRLNLSRSRAPDFFAIKAVSRIAATGRFNGGDINLFHGHHCFKCAFGGSSVTVGDGLRQRNGRDLPENTSFVFAPATFAFFTAMADNRLPVAVCFVLI